MLGIDASWEVIAKRVKIGRMANLIQTY